MALTKQQRERIVLAVLLVVAAVVWYSYFGKSKSATSGLVLSGPYTPINAEDYSVIFKEMGESQSTVYKSSGRNIFVAGPAPAEPTTVAGPAKPAEKPRLIVGPVRPPEPPLPVLTMKFFGYGSLPTNGPRRAFLLDGEDIHIVQEGDTVQNHIRITHIGNDRIEYEDTVTGKKNSSNLELPPQA
ncbi:MAG TPA: hypothetical protein VJX72_11010 [Candidatus Acidoferrum sp.]|jgi:hypothetical protein|nr:hypothetical protein [Candidatus Acidoferrum sp.]